MGLPVLLALLLVVAPPMGAVDAPTGGSADADSLGEVAILELNDSARTSHTTASVDVGAALAMQHDVAGAHLDRYTLDERFGNTGAAEDRQALLFESATAIEIRIASLRVEERTLRTAYANREMDTETFVRRLARLQARVGELRTSLNRIQAHADDIPQFSMRRRVRLLDASLFGFEGPVRERALLALRGERPPARLFVSVSEQGVVLSTLDDGQYVREAYRSDNRDTESDHSMGINEVDERAGQLYPVAYDPATSIRTGIQSLTGGLYRIEMELREGLITAYLDGATRSVFFEVQERRLDLLGDRPTAVSTANGTRIEVHRSYGGGPLQVSVTDNETETPLEATVMVAGTPHQTGADGTVWTLAPAGPFEVTAEGPRGNVTVLVRPLVATAVTGEG